jgi:predicted AlkP superfamily phosphohydrolase/phosphomutase
MKESLFVLGFDSLDPTLMEKWIDQGYLTNFKKLRESTAYGYLKNTIHYNDGSTEEIKANDALWPAFITGCRAHTTGFWTASHYQPENYELSCELHSSGYVYDNYPPFYALNAGYKVALFDLPYVPLIEDVNGVQLLGWGGHFPYTVNASSPPQIFPKMVQKHGANPLIYREKSAWWQNSYLKWLKGALKQSIAGCTAIGLDLLKQEDWDLFLMIFSEPHSSAHDLYSYSQSEHPLYSHLMKHWKEADPLLETYQCLDAALGRFLNEIPEDANLLCFSPTGMGVNFSEHLCQVVLPEILYRHSFPEEVAIAPGKVDDAVPKLIRRPIRNCWDGDTWVRLYEPNPLKQLWKQRTHKYFLRSDYKGLRSPYSTEAMQQGMGWMPAMWMQPLWPKMKAFALPGFSDGYIRLNVEGRDRDGVVPVADYDALCDELTQILSRLTCARTGRSIVRRVMRTRQSALDSGPYLPDFDLVVVWEEHMTDVVNSPNFGRVGPISYFRAGSHKNPGFVMVRNPAFLPGSNLPDSEVIDLPATILDLLGAETPGYFEGQSLRNKALLGKT